MNEEMDLEEYAPWVVVFITLVGGWLRVLMLGTKGMWLDETFSVWLANHPVGDMLQWIVKIDQHPPFYYYLLHYWIVLFGDTPYYARLLSVLFGAGTIPVIYLIGSTMDYKEDKFQTGFVFSNPNATGTCGCGESFSV